MQRTRSTITAAAAAVAAVALLVAGPTPAPAAPFVAGSPSSAPTTTPEGTAAVATSLTPLALSEEWRQQVQSPSSRDVSPAAVVRSSGEVANPSALVGGDGVTTLTYREGEAPPVVVLDYGKNIAGISRYEVASSTGAPVLHSGFSETLEFLTPSGDQGGFANLLFDSGASQRSEDVAVTGPGLLAGPIVQGAQRYQYLTLSTPGTVRLSSVGFRFTSFLGTADKLTGHFLSSDPVLNKIWYSGVYTLNINQFPAGTAQKSGQENNFNLIGDGGKRDRAPWTGDQLVAAPTAFYSVPLSYVGDTLRLFASDPGNAEWWKLAPDRFGLLHDAKGSASEPGPVAGACEPHSEQPECMMYSDSYSMMFVIALQNYLLYSGDVELAQELWPTVTRQMAWNERYVDADGLYAVEPGGAMNWNLESNAGVQTYVNAVYRQTLLAAADIGEAIGETTEVAEWRAAAERVKDAVNASLFNDTNGSYDPNADNRGLVTQDANVQAVLSGIATGSRARTVLDRISLALDTSNGRRSVTEPAPTGYNVRYSPYMGSLNLQAEFEAGNPERALSYIRSFWGRMVASDPGTIWERPNAEGKLTASDSAAHAWSTGPVSALSRYVLGVEPTDHGFASWNVEPVLADLRWSQGSVPTPHGNITVAWERTPKGGLAMTVNAPSGTTGTVNVPTLGQNRVIARNGQVVWDGERAVNSNASRHGDYVQFDVTGGEQQTYAWESVGSTVTPTPPTVTPPPASAVDKVQAKIATKMVKPVAVGAKRKLRVTVSARGVVPSGTVKIRLRGAGKQKYYVRTLSVRGRTAIWLPTFQRTGEVRVRINYLGDPAVKRERKSITFKVVQRRST